jgi:hypothetical protein
MQITILTSDLTLKVKKVSKFYDSDKAICIQLHLVACRSLLGHILENMRCTSHVSENETEPIHVNFSNFWPTHEL